MLPICSFILLQQEIQSLRSFCEGKRNQGLAPFPGHLHHGIAGLSRVFVALPFRLRLKTQGPASAPSDAQSAANTAVKVNPSHFLRPDSDGPHLTATPAAVANRAWILGI